MGVQEPVGPKGLWAAVIGEFLLILVLHLAGKAGG
jgi:hypothetical protein